MGKIYAISKCPLYQGFILQSNIEKVLSPPIGICFAIIFLYQTVKKLFSSSNGFVLRLILPLIAFPEKSAISMDSLVLPSKIVHRLDLEMLILTSNFVLFTLPSLTNSASYSYNIFVFSFMSSVFLLRIDFGRHD